MICRCCGSPRLREYCKCLDDHRLRYLRCAACGSLNLTTTYEACRHKYHRADYAEQFVEYCGSPGKLAETFRYHLDGMDLRHPSRGAALDIGCGGGGFLFAAQQRGWDAWGFDVAVESREAVLRHYNLTREQVVVESEFSAAIFSRQFEVVHCCEVIEHVESPRKLLVEMVAALAPGGTLYVQTPTPEGGTETIWNQDVHLCIMPEEALRWLLYDVGLEIDENLSTTWLRELPRMRGGVQPAGGQCYFCRVR